MQFDDPGFAAQNAATLGPDGINILSAYGRYSGAGIRIGIVDTGIRWDHPDLVGQVDTGAGWSAETHSPDSYAGPDDKNHGTQVALILGSKADNGIGGVGAAWGATLVSYELAWLDSPTHAEQDEVLSRQWQVDISSNSWGVLPYTDNFLGAGWREGESIAEAATIGRDGLGTVIIRSAGNNATEGDDVNARNYANNRYTITVGAVDETGAVQDFTTRGSAVWVAAPANATSFAVPLVSGTVALMLEANPDLGYRDVQTILALSSRPASGATGPVKTSAAADFLDGGGFQTSRAAGFGIVDAAAAIRLAESWDGPARTEANIEHAGAAGAGFSVPNIGTASAKVTIAEDILVERAVLTLHMDHAMMSTVKIWLTSPSGTESLLLDRMLGGLYPTPGGSIDFQYTSTQFFWEASPGTWTLRVEDTSPFTKGNVRGWSLDLYGAPNGPDDTYYYSDSFAARAGADATRRVLADPDGGIDGLNAAAVSSASVIDLGTGGSASRIDGVALTIAQGTIIEKAWGGEGADSITGNSQGNTLSGGWGGDRIDGAGGADSLAGGEGADTLLGGNYLDTLRGDAGDDSLAGGSGRDWLGGGEGADTLNGDLGLDSLEGGAGADVFLFDSSAEMTDTILDFVQGEDRIGILADGFGARLPPGPLPEPVLTTGPRAVGAGPQFVFDPANGALMWDVDGAGGAAAIRIALLTSLPALQAGDLVILA